MKMLVVFCFVLVSMPSHKSAEKAVRQALRRSKVNRARKSRIHTFVRDVETSVASFGKNVAVTKELLEKNFVSAQKELMRGASRGVLHKNAAARKVARLYSKVRKALTAGEVSVHA
jgi:small subunit ribosomal protein S20